MTREVALARLIRIASRVLPDVDAMWGDAMSAELQAIPTRREQMAFTASSLRGLAAIAFSRQLRQCFSNASTLFVATGLGIMIAAVDLHADSRWPLRIGLLLSCAAVGWTWPRVAPLAGVLAGLGLPVVATLSGYRGPYQLDRGDMWFPVLPALITAAVAAALRNRMIADGSS